MTRKPLVVLLAALLSACSNDTSAPTPNTTQLSSSKSSARLQAAPGIQTQTFGGARSDYVVSNLDGVFKVSTKQGGTAVQISAATQRIKFADGTLVLDIDGYAGTVYRVYQAAFDRKPDMAGYAFWLSVADAGESVESIAAGFVNSVEFKNLYGANPSNNDLLTRYYQNVLHRAPDSGGFNFWLNALNGGATNPVQVLAQFSDSDENKAQVLADIRNGIWIPGDGKLGAAFASGAPSMAVGQVQTVNITGVSASAVEVRVGGTKVPVAVLDGMVAFSVPETAAGATTVSISSGTQSVDISTTVTQTVLPQAPAPYLNSFLDGLDATLATAILSATGSKKLQYEQMQRELKKQKAGLATMSEAQLRAKALLVMANFGQPTQVLSTAASADGVSATCLADTTKAIFYNTPLLLSIGVLGLGVATLDPILIIPAALAFAKVWEPTKARAGAAWENCVTTTADTLVLNEQNLMQSNFSGAQRRAKAAMESSASLSFVSKKTRTYTIMENATLAPAASGVRTMMHAAGAALGTAQPVAQLFGVDLSADAAYASGYGADKKTPGKAGDYYMGGISDPRIDGKSVASGSTLALTFSFGDKVVVDAPVKFSFKLVSTKNGVLAEKTINAVLSPTPPAIVDAVFSVSSKVTEVVQPAPLDLEISCSASPTGVCKVGIFCKAPDELGSSKTEGIRFVLDGEKETATLYFGNEYINGSYSMASGAINAYMKYDEEIGPDINTPTSPVKFSGYGIYHLKGIYNAQTKRIEGTIYDVAATTWSYDGTVKECSSTSSFVATQATQ